MDLTELRDRLNALDAQMIDLVAERLAVVERIGELKRSEHRPTRDFAREKQVIEQARARASAQGVPPALADGIMRLLIHSSLANQEQARVRAEGQGQGQPALVIGGAGKMGRWFTTFLQSQGYAVTVADPAGPVDDCPWLPDWRAATGNWAITVVAAPLGHTATVLDEFEDVARFGLIFDIGSLKSPLVDSLRRLAARGARVTSLHPMFGPDTSLLSGRHVLFLDVGCAAATREARTLFASTMAEQIEMDIDEHDRLIGYVLGLSHALNIAFFTALAESGEALPRLADLSSTTFDAQLDVAARVARESPQLYFEIQSLNPHGLLPLEELLAAMGRITDIVRGKDEAAFVALMEKGREYLARRG